MWSSTAVGANCWLWQLIKSGCFRNCCHLCCFHFQTTRRCQDFMQVASSVAVKVLRFGSWLAFTYPCRPKTASSFFPLSLSLSLFFFFFFFLPIFLVGTQGVLGLLHESRCSFVTHLSRTLYVFVWVLHWRRWSASVGVFCVLLSSCVLYCVGGKEEQKKKRKRLALKKCALLWWAWDGLVALLWICWKNWLKYFSGFWWSIDSTRFFFSWVGPQIREREREPFLPASSSLVSPLPLVRSAFLFLQWRERERVSHSSWGGGVFFRRDSFLLALQLRTEIMQCSSSSGV